MVAKVIPDHWVTLVAKGIVEAKVIQAVKVILVVKETRATKELVLDC